MALYLKSIINRHYLKSVFVGVYATVYMLTPQVEYLDPCSRGQGLQKKSVADKLGCGFVPELMPPLHKNAFLSLSMQLLMLTTLCIPICFYCAKAQQKS